MTKLHKNDITALEFLHLNDIRGHDNLKYVIYHYGLIDDGELVMLVSISKNNNEIVLNRCCNKFDISIVDGIEKLIDNILSDYPEMNIKVWTDNRWETGEIYSKIGFSMMKEIKSDYSYVGISGKEIRKSKYVSKEEIKLYNYDRIWDCGKICWILKNKKKSRGNPP